MAKDKKSFLLYCDIIHTVKKLSDEQAGILLKHILLYVNDENPTIDNLVIELVFEPIKQQLKRDLKRYEGTCEKNKENILKRWNKTDTTEYDRIEPNTNHTDTDNDTDSDSDKERKVYKKKFIVPTLEQVKLYCLERQNSIDPQYFLDNNEMKGWVWGKTEIPVKSWKALIRTWERHQNTNLGSFEKTNEKGQRYYDNGIIIPKDAAPRPSAKHYWNAELNKWGIS